MSPTFQVTCGHRIVVTSDQDISIVAKCSNGKKYYKSDHYSVFIKIPISYERRRLNVCSLYQFPKKHVYAVQISVSHLHQGRTRADIREYIITCSFESHGRVVSKQILLEADNFNYEEIVVNKGKLANIKVSLFLENINGKKITDKIDIGRKVKLATPLTSKFNKPHPSKLT
eukprot:XP_014785781.1 PREDICTED: uncharacterized protein LOC106880366 [Octopus bimaculoides]